MALALTDLLQTVGPPALVPWSMPAGEAPTVRAVTIHDRVSGEDAPQGGVVLAVGLDRAEQSLLLRSAAGAGAAAVVVRADPDARTALVAEAADLDLPLLALSPAVGWETAAALLRNAVAIGGDGDHLPAHHDLTAVANNLAAALNGSVLVFNPRQEIIAFSRLRPEDDLMRRRAIAEQRGPAEYRERVTELGVYRELWGSDEVVTIPPVPELEASRRLAVAIRAGEEILGSIWVAEGSEPLSSDAHAVLRSAAVAASGHLTWLQARAETQRRFAEGLVRQLLDGGADVTAVAGWLGVPADQACLVALVATPDPRHRSQVAGQLVLHFSAFRATPLVTPLHDSVALVLTGLGDATTVPATLPETMARIGRAVGEPLLVAVGEVGSGFADLPRSRARAEEVLGVLRRTTGDGSTRVAGPADVRVEVRLGRVGRLLDDADVADGPAGRLVAADEEHQTPYAASVLAFLDALGNVADAAARLDVHPNTLRYRLKRAEEVAGLDLADPGARTLLQLELRVLLADPTARDERGWTSG